ncbi:MAG: O-methyltransferase [Bacteroidaceae bacterium]|nr:O-methyltransferase [Bacteroidaceae bacterium]
MMTEALNDYLLEHITPEHPYLHALFRATQLQLVRGHMASGHLQGELLTMLVKMVRPRRVLEIGTYSGYSALAMARGLDEGAELVTFEVNDEMEDFTRPWIERSPWADKVKFLIGDARDHLEPDERFDLIFIDANKRHYCDYLELSLAHLSPEGFILADNTLWDGHVVESQYDKDAQTVGIREFNDMVAHRADLEVVMLPLRDGLTLLRRKI